MWSEKWKSVGQVEKHWDRGEAGEEFRKELRASQWACVGRPSWACAAIR